MTLVKFNPHAHVAPFNRFNGLDKFIADVFNTPIFNDDLPHRSTNPSVNIVENADSYRLEVAAPGLAKEDFKVNIEDKTLTISAEKKVETKTETDTKDGDKFVRREFGFSQFSRSFTLPETVAADGIKATYEAGVLHVALPKKEVVKMAQTIEIQ